MDPQLAVVGAGNLGLALVQRLAATGHAPLVHDTDQQAAARAEQAGGTLAPPDRIGAEADAVWVLVPDAEALAQVLTEQLLRALAGRAVLLQSSTVGPDTAQELGERAATVGLDLVDAPVSGGAEAARDGELLVLLGGPAPALDRAEPVAALAASRTVRTGPAGSASLVKLANQHALFAGLTALHEAVALTSAGGVAEDVTLQALGAGTARSWLTETWGFYDRLDRDYDARDVPTEHRPWVKDLAEVARIAARLGVDLPSLPSTRDRLPTLLQAHADPGSDPDRPEDRPADRSADHPERSLR